MRNARYDPMADEQYGAPNNPFSDTSLSAAEELEKSSTFRHNMIISITAVLLIALSAALLLLITRQNSSELIPDTLQDTQQIRAAIRSYAEYAQYETEVSALIIDDVTVDLPQKMLRIENYHYVPLEAFAGIFGYTTVVNIDRRQAVLEKGGERVFFTADVSTATRIGGNEQETIQLLDYPILFDNRQMYVQLRSLKSVFKFESIVWNGETREIVIRTDGITVPTANTTNQTQTGMSATNSPGSGSTVNTVMPPKQNQQ